MIILLHVIQKKDLFKISEMVVSGSNTYLLLFSKLHQFKVTVVLNEMGHVGILYTKFCLQNFFQNTNFYPSVGKNALNWLLSFNLLHVKLLAQLCHDVTTIKMSINRKQIQSCGLARVKLLDRSFIIEFIIFSIVYM